MTILPDFERFIGIDWSGAKAGYGNKIQVAIAKKGESAPELFDLGVSWTRQSVMNWLTDERAAGLVSLIGFDFSFAPPFVDHSSFLPGETEEETAADFWSYVDAECNDEDLGAASFLEARRGRYFYLGAMDGEKAPYMRLRACEKRFNALGGGKPSSIFDAIGAAQVAKASFAGMRVLHRLKHHYSIWPYQEPVNSCIVEIYCRLFLKEATGAGKKIRDYGQLNHALARLNSLPVLAMNDVLSDDQSDALIAAAGLRHFASKMECWRPSGLKDEVRRTEGWTFGVF